LIDVKRDAVIMLEIRMAARTRMDSAANGIAQKRLRGFGARAATSGAGGASTIGCCVSVTEFTVRAAWIVGLALVALLCVGWRKSARAAPRIPRGQRPPRAGIAVTELAAPTYRRTAIWRRVWAISGTGFLTVLTGAIIAIVTAFAVSWTVTTLSSLLKH